MSNCLALTNGIPAGCNTTTGGIKRALITNLVNTLAINGGAIDIPDPSSGVTGITLSASTYFYEFVPNKLSGKADQTFTKDVSIGSAGYEQVITLVFSKNESSKRNTIRLLGQQSLVIIIEDMNGVYWLYGKDNGLDMNNTVNTTGTKMNELSGWTITLTGSESEPAYWVDNTTAWLEDKISA